MTEILKDSGTLVSWSIPQCPFGIEYSRKALDDIRLAVVDAFFSLPRGGAEIGGILLGRFEEQRLQILDYAPIECEHAFGPVFTLSPADQTRLGEMLRQNYPGGLRPVGWYHSHTRSEISLCEADLDIHNRYFPEPWQVALVLRPSTLQPTQAGFFFRESDGSIHTQSSYQEFALEALPVQPVYASGPEAVPGPMRETEPDAIVLTLPPAAPEPSDSAMPEPPSIAEEPPQPIALLAAPAEVPAAEEASLVESQPAAEALAEPILARMPKPLFSSFPEAESSLRLTSTVVEAPHPQEHEPEETNEPADTIPAFAGAAEAPSTPHRRWIGIAAGLAAGLALGLFAGQARSHSQPAPPPAPVPVVTQRPALAPAVPSPEDAALRKRNEDLSKQVADLSQQNTNLKKENADLSAQQAGLAKQDAELSKQQAELNKQQGEAGKRQTELRQQRDDLLKQTAKLKADLTAQTAHAQALQQQVDDLRRQQQRRRLSIQSSDPLP